MKQYIRDTTTLFSKPWRPLILGLFWNKTEKKKKLKDETYDVSPFYYRDFDDNGRNGNYRKTLT